MSVEDDLATVTRLLVSQDSIPVQLHMRQGLDEERYAELVLAIERLTERFRNSADVPKSLALAFVDVAAAFTFPEGVYPLRESERIEDAGHELSYLGQTLFSDED